MSKLVRAGLRRLFRYRLYHIGLLVCAIFPVWASVIRYLDIRDQPDLYETLDITYTTVEVLAFSSLVMMAVVVMVVVSSLFLGTEYSDGTIRNKLVAGHQRSDIYLASYLVCAVANLSMLYMNYLSAFTFGKLILKGSWMTFAEVFGNMLCETFSVLSFTAVLVLVSMLIRSKAGASVTALLLTLFLYIMAMTVENALCQPEYKTIYETAYEDEVTGEIQVNIKEVPNPNYLTGAKRKVYEQAEALLPFGQFFVVTDGRYESYGRMGFYDVMIVFVLGGIGIFFFQRKDLK